MEVDWLQLPEDLTSHVMSKLSCITDYARFGDVCVKWRSIFRQDYYKISILSQLPLLMVPTQENKKKNKKNKKNKKKKNNTTTLSCSFYRVTDGKIFNRLQLTLPSDRYIRGSSHGWLITVDEDDICFSIQLMNPFFYPNTYTKEIKLPPLIAHPSEQNDPGRVDYFHLQKTVLSADPISNPKDVIVMAIFGEFSRLSFCKPGDHAWTPIQVPVQGFHDIVYYQGNFYAVDQYGTVVICNLEERITTTYARPPATNKFCDKIYLVVSAGIFFQVHRYTSGLTFKTVAFKVFNLQRREADVDWVEVKDLSGHAFFIGDSASMSISASDFPGCKLNCIYYTDDYVERYWSGDPSEGPHDLGLFNLENESFEKHYPTDTGIHLWPAPLWIEPTLPRSIARSKHNVTFNDCC